MAIAPVDLQTLFAQLDKVGKTFGSQREGQALQQAIQGVQLQKKTEENIQQVNETQNTGEGTEKVNDQNQKQQEGSSKKKQNDDSQKEEENKGNVSVLKDPVLGKNIDISL